MLGHHMNVYLYWDTLVKSIGERDILGSHVNKKHQIGLNSCPF